MVSKSRRLKKFLSLMVITVLMLVVAQRAALAQEAKSRWPMKFEHPKGTAIMYQPQLEDMKGDKLTAYAALSVQKKEWKEPVFGAVWLAGRVVTDRDTRMVTIDNVKITDAKFPNAKPEQMEKLKAFLNEEMQDLTINISQDRLLAALAVVEKERAGDADLKNAPPKVIFKSHPAVLVLLDGEPKLLPIPDSKLMRVANTPFIMAYDPAAKTYYLKGGDAWLSATDPTGAWKDVETLPASVQALADKMRETKEKAAQKVGRKQAKKEVQKIGGEMPEVIVSTVPAELLVTDGDPQYTPVKGTNLLFVSNTESNIFMDTGSQEYYTILSGRWFQSKSLQDGPWSYVAPDKLPADFAKIPPDSTKGFVLVNVGGTEQAKEAVLDNYIPQTAAIDRKKATTEVKYDGDPKFDQISGTNLEYAVNTGTTVFKEGTKYYAVDQGVWYEADSPNGPWQVSVNPPQEVNKIPPSNPHYNAKYVKVYESNDDTAYVGYTPGYTGSYVDNGTVVYGTGYNYPAYSTNDTYIPPAVPATYGYAATYDPYDSTWGYQPSYYNPLSWLGPSLIGFGLGYATGVATSNWWNRNWYGGGWYGGGWWGSGGYNYTNVNITHNYIYNRPWNPGDRWPGYRPGERPGWKPGERPGRPGGPGWKPGEGPGRPGRPSQLPANIYNRPGNENRLASRPGRPAQRPVSGVRPGRPGARPERPVAQPRPETRPVKPQARPAGGKNNVFADRSGNVYRRGSQGNWQQRQGGQWKPAATPGTRPGAVSRPTPRPRPGAAPRPSFQSGQMNREFAARQRGQVRTQNFQRAQSSPAFRPSSRPSGGFSRPSGGGGGRPSGGISRPAGSGGGGPRGGGGGGRGGGGGQRR
jgi:hypothetical protein